MSRKKKINGCLNFSTHPPRKKHWYVNNYGGKTIYTYMEAREESLRNKIFFYKCANEDHWHLTSNIKLEGSIDAQE